TEYPLRFLAQEVFLCQDFFCLVASACFQCSDQFIGSCSVCSAASIGIQPFLSGSFHILVVSVCHYIFYFLFQTLADCILSQQHTITKLCVVLEQRVIPCRTLAFCIHGVRCGR